MPLQAGSSQSVVSANIAELVRSGRDPKQAAAIAHRNAGKDAKAASDMSPDDWQGLVGGLLEFFSEEAQEPEHEDTGGAADEKADQIAFDRAGSVRDYDSNGWLHIRTTPISKANICEYRGREIPGAEQLGLDPERKYRLLRHPDELRKAAPTFNNLPLLKRHVPISATQYDPDDVIGSTGTDASFEQPYLTNSLVVWRKPAIDDVENDQKKEISSAYRYRADMTSGTYEGERFDGIMRDILGNHVILCREGRAGPDVVVGDSKDNSDHPTMENFEMSKTVLTRKGAMLQGALMGFLAPRLAADAKVELAPVLLDVSHASFPKQRAAIATKIGDLVVGKLAKDAKLDDLPTFLMAFDAVEPEEEKKAKDAEDLPEVGGGKGKSPAKDRKAKDKKAGDKKARDEAKEDFKEKMKERMSAEDWKAACDEIDDMMDAEDAEKDENDETPDPEKTNGKDKKGKDEEPMSKEDGKKAMDEAIAGERKRQRDVRDAERFVRPWVGDLAIAYDSAEEVFGAALKARGKGTDGIHPSAFKSILEMLPKPGSERQQRLANDARPAGNGGSFAEMFPDAAKIKLTA